MEPPITLVTPSTDVLRGGPPSSAIPEVRSGSGQFEKFGNWSTRIRIRPKAKATNSNSNPLWPTKFFAESSNRHPKPAKDAKNNVGENDFPFYARISRAGIFARITSAAVASCH